jgi:hypothetical protein
LDDSRIPASRSTSSRVKRRTWGTSPWTVKGGPARPRREHAPDARAHRVARGVEALRTVALGFGPEPPCARNRMAGLDARSINR